MADESQETTNPRSNYKQKYKRVWELDIELRDWLTACPADEYSGYCRFCQTTLHAHKKGLIAHGKSMKHKKRFLGLDMQNALTNGEPQQQPPQPPQQTEATTKTIDDASADKRDPKKSKSLRHFKDSWLQNPMFSSWLRKIPNNTSKGLCLACRSLVTAGKCELQKHAAAAKHKKAMAEGSLEEFSQVDLDRLEASANTELSVAVVGQVRPNLVNVPGMQVDEVIDRLTRHVPLELAEDWDNVGVITRPTRGVKVYHILLTIDLDDRIVEEAIRRRVQFIISYHPPIFSAIKKLSPKQWKEKAVLKCVENMITIYSPHTSLDAIGGGINDWLVTSFMAMEGSTSKPITSKKAALCYEYQVTDGGDLQEQAPVPIAEFGMGRLVTLASPLLLTEVITRTKIQLDLQKIRIAMAQSHSRETRVTTIAVCAGSGSSILKGCQADVWITGEMSHHDILDAIHNNTTVLLAEHTNTERGFLADWSRQLRESVFENHLSVFTSDLDKDPVTIG